MQARLSAALQVLLAFTYLVLSTSAHAQTLEITGKLLSGMKEVHDALDTLDTLDNAAHDALAEKKVSAGTGWSKLADKFTKAAKDVESAPLPTEPSVVDPVTAQLKFHQLLSTIDWRERRINWVTPVIVDEGRSRRFGCAR
jgi:hypothetical protein